MARFSSRLALSAICLICVAALTACGGSHYASYTSNSYSRTTARTAVKLRGAESVFTTETVLRTSPQTKE